MNWISRFKANLRQHGHEAEHADDRVSVLAIAPWRDHQQLDEIAQRAHWSLDFVTTLESGREALRQAVKPVIICDRDLGGCNWRDVVETLVAEAPGSVVLLASSTDEESLWEELVRAGGYDVLRKPFEFERVAHAVHFAWMYWKFTNSHLAASKEKSGSQRPL